jgi:hypothetical protein
LLFQPADLSKRNKTAILLHGDPDLVEAHQSSPTWSLSVETIRRMFEREPGVLIFENPDKGSERRRRTMRIPEPVADRVYRRLSTRQFGRKV